MTFGRLFIVTAAAAAAAIIAAMGTPGLSAARKRVLTELAAVLPAVYGDANFGRIAPGYDPTDPALPEGFTTCGFVPCFIGRLLGYRDGITKCGIEELRTVGRKTGTWKEPPNKPKPLDPYGLSNGGILTHVGAVIDPTGDTWITADAGQREGTKQAARYVRRAFDGTHLGGPAGPRLLAGWIDLDEYLEKVRRA